MSLMLLGGLSCFLALFAIAALGVLLVVRSERRRETAMPERDVPSRPVHATADVSLYLRFDGVGADAMGELADRHPYGVLPVELLRPTAEAVLHALDEATHGVLVVAAHKAEAVRVPAPAGLVVCLRARSRTPIAVPARPAHRHDLAALLRDLAVLDPEQVISADFLRAKIGTDRAAPVLEVLLGPHLPPPNP